MSQLRYLINAIDTDRRETIQGLAHDLKKPFSLMKTYIGVLEEANDPLEVKEILVELKRDFGFANEVAQTVIAELMEVPVEGPTKSSKGVGSEQFVVRNLVETMERVGQCLELHHGNKKLQMRFVGLPEGRVLGSKGDFARIFTNVVGNALEATPENDTVVVEVSFLQSSFVQVNIVNSGLLSRSQIEKIRSGRCGSSKESGTGIGVRTAESIARRIGGLFDMASYRSEDGNKVEVMLRFPLL
jgi:signal transduction histidine kinase